MRDYRAHLDAPVADVIAGEPCWRPELLATSATAGYARVVVWMTQAEWLPRRAEYFGASGRRLRVVEYPNARVIDGRLHNDTWIIRSIRTESQTTTLTVESVIPRDHPPELFTRRYLELHR